MRPSIGRCFEMEMQMHSTNNIYFLFKFTRIFGNDQFKMEISVHIIKLLLEVKESIVYCGGNKRYETFFPISSDSTLIFRKGKKWRSQICRAFGRRVDTIERTVSKLSWNLLYDISKDKVTPRSFSSSPWRGWESLLFWTFYGRAMETESIA